MENQTFKQPMPPTIAFKQKCHKLDGYILEKNPLGVGAYGTVYKGYNKEGQSFAVKVFKMDKLEDFDAEIKSFKDLDHPNIVKMYDSSHYSTMHRSNEFPAEIKVCYLVFELICGGELFEYILKPPTFSEPVVRTLFQQILSAIQYCHGKGLSHRDLKLENLLLDQQFKVRIADFGTAKVVDKHNILKTTTGTAGYMAPEVANDKGYNGFLADVFSLGSCLFMLATRMPVTEGECGPKDGAFKYMCQGRNDKFWKNREKISQRYQVDFVLSPNLKDLLNGMLTADPAKRPTLEQVIKHPWVQGGPTVTQDQIMREFSQRLGEIDPEMEKKRKERCVELGEKVYMNHEEPEDELEIPVMGSKKTNVLYSWLHPVVLMQQLQEKLEVSGITPAINEDTWTVNYQVPMKNRQEPDEEEKDEDYEDEIKLNVQIDFQKFNADCVALVFTTKDCGPAKWLLVEHCQEVAQEAKDFALQITQEENKSQNQASADLSAEMAAN